MLPISLAARRSVNCYQSKDGCRTPARHPPATAGGTDSITLLNVCLAIVIAWFSISVSINVNAQQASPAPTPDNDPLKALQWRLIGPFRGGRVTAVSGVGRNLAVVVDQGVKENKFQG